MTAKLNDEQRQGLQDFQATSKGILTPTDYFLAGIEFATREDAGISPTPPAESKQGAA